MAKDIEQFKDELEKAKKEIEDKIKGLDKVPELGEGADPDIETQETQEYDNQLSIMQVLKKRLIAINDSLLKFGKKKYGVCESCGRSISEDLLKIVPESKFCKECKRTIKH